jgi:hypothetical protein
MAEGGHALVAPSNGDKYGLLTYQTNNLGDEVQSIAAAQFLPAIDLRVDRDLIDSPPAGVGGRYKIIMNGWHNHAPERWPPGPFVIPLLTSIHITGEVFPANAGGLKPSDVLLRGENLDYLRGHGPVGARDLWTRDLLLRHGVDSFFSGCMTLTLGAGAVADARRDYVCAVDLPPPLLRHLRGMTQSRLVTRTHHQPLPGGFGERAALARYQLSLYSQAKCVVTTRLHCALPCLAMGTPVLFIAAAKDLYRFSGLIDLLHACSPRQFLDGLADFDPENPPANSDAYKAYRAALIDSTTRFVGAETALTGAPLHSFVPETVTDRMLDETQPSPSAPTTDIAADIAFRGVFPPGRDYARDSRPDFFRDIARVHERAGDRAEAERLLRIALQERPTGAVIRERLESLEQARLAPPGASVEEPVAGRPPPRWLVSAVRGGRHTYLSPARLESLITQTARVKARSVPGNFIECGIGLGGSGICIAGQLDGAREYWGFDVFGMIPPPSDADGDGAKNRYAVIASGQSGGIGDDPYYGYVPDLYRQVTATFAEFGLRVDGHTINLVQGLFQDSLPRHANFPIALAHIDCDWYEHVKYCLNFIQRLVPRYGVIVVDDYGDWPGCKKAVDEFLSENPNMLLEIESTHAVIVKM